MRLTGFVCALGLTVAAAAGDAHALPDDGVPGEAGATTDAATFVRVRGRELVLNDRPFRFVGANLSVMHGPDNRAAAEEIIAGAARDGLTVARVWALGEGEDGAAAWLRENFLFRAGPRGWVEAGPRHLDRVIAAARRAGLRLIITLSNSWADYGGVPRYLRWTGCWRERVYGATDRFYSDAEARASYREHVRRLLERTNELTGVRYRDEPAILAWELMNESTVATAAGARARLGWIAEMAALIHRLAPNHLVMSGVSGYRVERERADWLAACRLPAVDLCDGHLYPEEALRNRGADEAEPEVNAALDDFVRAGQTVVGKPFVLGEFGVRGDGSGSWAGRSRAAWTAQVLERLRFDGAAGGLVWIYQRAGGADRAHGIDVVPESDSTGSDGPLTPALAASTAIRQVMRRAAAALAADSVGPPPGGFNPDVARPLTDGGLRPLHRAFAGASWSVPLVRAGAPDAGALELSWNPTAYARADWEASGVHGGGEVEHAWGGETGWFEYEYEVVGEAPVEPAAGRPPSSSSAGTNDPGGLMVTVRARVSSEYPGTLAPPDGASAFVVSLDGVEVATGVAAPDDGRGRWVALRGRVPAGALAPGRHRVRFTVPAGPRAHGLSIYGRTGEKPGRPVDTGPIQLHIERRR